LFVNAWRIFCYDHQENLILEFPVSLQN
jgi:hypothetical protein